MPKEWFPDLAGLDVLCLASGGGQQVPLFVVKYALPYVEHEVLSPDALAERVANREMFHFSHSMEAQLGGLTNAGFVITDFYEDHRTEEDGNPICHYLPSYYVARAQKMS